MMRREIVAALCLALTLALTGCSAMEPVEMTLLYTGDTHGYVVADHESVIGIDTVAALKSEDENALLVDAGDFLSGAPFATLTQGSDVVELMRVAGYDAAALGVGDFAYGGDVLRERVDQAGESFPVLSANVTDEQGVPVGQAYAVTETAGVRAGLFGLMLADVPGFAVLDPIKAAGEAIKALKKEKCQLIIALVHLGDGGESALSGVDIADAHKDIDIVVVGGAQGLSGEAATSGETIASGAVAASGAPIVSAGADGHALGKMQFRLDDDGVTVVSNELLDYEFMSAVPGDDRIAAKIAQIQEYHLEMPENAE